MAGKKTFAKGKATAAKVTKAKVATKSKTSGSGKIDQSKAIKAAVAKELSKNIETQHSYADILLRPEQTLNGVGFKMSSLNTRPIPDDQGVEHQGFDNNSIMAYNLSNMLQVRSAASVAASGWRTGFESNVLSIRVDVRGICPSVKADCKYHALIARKKDGVRPNWHAPLLLRLNDTGLWRSNFSGPHGNSSLHYDYPTLDKRNTESWSFPTGCHVEKLVIAGYDETITRSFQLSMYKEIKDVWKFNSDDARADPALKDGDYCLFVFREGPDDHDARDTTIRVTIDIAFKDC